MGDLSNHITVHNDVDAALLGELVLHKYPESHIFCLTLGTGIGGAFYTQQHGLYTGARYHANEIGYLLYRSSDGLTYEQRASTSALKALIKAYGLDANISVPALLTLQKLTTSNLSNCLMIGEMLLLRELRKYKSSMIQI